MTPVFSVAIIFIRLRVSTIRLSPFFHNKENFVLKNINLEIKQGEKVVLMGKSGSGKTTLLKLIMGLYLPDTGRISIGGKSYTQLDVLRLRKKIAYVEQEPLLFKGSIGNNIMLNNESQHNNMSEIENAARLANAHEFIIQMENGYETPLERFGTNLSLGQKQRIAISRFFYKGSDILILDEPTSAIDLQSIELIRESLQKIPPHKTIIMVTHNPSIARFADRIILLDDAKIYGDYNSNEMTEDIISIIKNK